MKVFQTFYLLYKKWLPLQLLLMLLQISSPTTLSLPMSLSSKDQPTIPSGQFVYNQFSNPCLYGDLLTVLTLLQICIIQADQEKWKVIDKRLCGIIANALTDVLVHNTVCPMNMLNLLSTYLSPKLFKTVWDRMSYPQNCIKFNSRFLLSHPPTLEHFCPASS